MLYEYNCKCGNKFEANRPLAEMATAVCPKCGATANKVFSLFNVTWTWIIDGLHDDKPRRWDEFK
jgi:putative FmdB family regulatory protein